ncbi:hypothetical protein [Streptomyces sp. cmx-4-25]
MTAEGGDMPVSISESPVRPRDRRTRPVTTAPTDSDRGFGQGFGQILDGF